MKEENFKALVVLNLLDVVGVSRKEEKEQRQYLQQFNRLVWTLFFEFDGKDMSEEDLGHIEEFLEEKNFEQLEEYLEERLPDLKARITANTVLAKQILIARHLGKLIFILRSSNLVGQKELLEELEASAQLVREEKWAEFSKKYNFLDKLRDKIDGNIWTRA